MTNYAVFLDRDGVINRDLGYVYRPEDFEFIDGIFRLSIAIRKAGYKIIVVTNQAGVARGFYTEDDLNRLHEWLRRQFRERGADIDAFYYCPCHPEGTVERYRQNSPDRKPEPGMILRAARDFSIDVSRSVMLGDKESDIEAGRRAGVGALIRLDASYKGSLERVGDVLRTGSLDELSGFFDRMEAGNLLADLRGDPQTA